MKANKRPAQSSRRWEGRGWWGWLCRTMEASGWWSNTWCPNRSPCSTRIFSYCTCPLRWQWPTRRSPSSPSGPHRLPCWSDRFWHGHMSTNQTSFCSFAGQTGKRWHLYCKKTCKWPGASTLSDHRRTAEPLSGESRQSRRRRWRRYTEKERQISKIDIKLNIKIKERNWIGALCHTFLGSPKRLGFH